MFSVTRDNPFSLSLCCFHSRYKVPLFNLHVFNRLFTAPHRTRATSRFSIYMVFTCFLQALFHLHCFYMFLTGPLFSFTWLLHVSYRAPFFIYMVFTCFLQLPFFSFTWFLHVSYRPPFFIYMVFACFLQAPFFIYMVFTCFLQAPFFIYMVFTGLQT